jgi:hypothetical protein
VWWCPCYVTAVYVNCWSWHVHGSHSVCLLKPGVTVIRCNDGRTTDPRRRATLAGVVTPCALTDLPRGRALAAPLHVGVRWLERFTSYSTPGIQIHWLVLLIDWYLCGAWAVAEHSTWNAACSRIRHANLVTETPSIYFFTFLFTKHLDSLLI